MSTKIYNAYFVRQPLRLIFSGAKTLERGIVRKWIKKMNAMFDSYDPKRFTVSKTVFEIEILSTVLSYIQQGLSSFNPECSLVVYPYPGSDSFIVQTFGVEDKEAEGRFIKKLFGKDFHFQDQSDPPEDVHPDRWEERKKIWEKVLPGTQPPSKSGFSYDMITKESAGRLALEVFFERHPSNGTWDAKDLALFEQSDFSRGWMIGGRSFLKEWVTKMGRRYDPQPVIDSLDSALL